MMGVCQIWPDPCSDMMAWPDCCADTMAWPDPCVDTMTLAQTQWHVLTLA